MKRHSWRAKFARTIVKSGTKPNVLQRLAIIGILLTYKKGTPVRDNYLPGLSGGKLK